MRKIKFVLLILILVFLLSSGPCFADYLVCDPYTEGEVDHFLVSLDGQPAVEIPYSLHISGAAIVFDLSTLGDIAAHSFDIRAVNAQGRESDPVPFGLIAKPSASNLLSIRIVE